MPWIREEPKKKGRWTPERIEPSGIPLFPGITPEEQKEFEQRGINAGAYSKMLNIPPSQAYEAEDAITQGLWGEKATPESAWGRIKQSWDIGDKMRQLGELRYRQLSGDQSDELREEIEKLKGSIPPPDQIKRSLPEQALSAAAEMLPIQLEGIKRGTETGLALGTGAAAIAALAGQAGPQVLVPEEIVTVPGAFMGMFSVGMTYGLLTNIGEIEAGLALDELTDLKDEKGNPINPRLATTAAAGVGIINGLIEVAQIKLLFKTIPGGDKLLRGAIRKVTREAVMGTTLKDIILKYAGRYGSFLGRETAQEIAQESTNILAGELAKEVHERLEGAEIPKATIEEITGRLTETARQSALAFSVMGIPGHVVGVARDVATREKMAEAEEEVTDKVTLEAERKEEVFARPIEKPVEKPVEPEPGVPKAPTFEATEATQRIMARQREGTLTIEDALEHMTWEIESGEVYEKRKIGNRFVSITSYPEWFRDRGYKREQVLSALRKKEGPLYEDLKDIAEERLGELKRSYAKDIPAADLNRWDVLTMASGEKFTVTAIKPGEITLKNAEPIKVDEFDIVPGVVRIQRGGKLFSIKKYFPTKMGKRARKEAAQSVGELITEIDTLYESITEADKAVKKAISEGKKEVVAKEKARKALLEERATERKKTKQHIQKLAKAISKPAGKGVEFYYREAIENLQAAIDPSFRRKKTLEQRERTKAFLEQKPEALKDMPTKLLRTLEKKALNEYTIGELEEVAAEIKRLRKQGSLKRGLKVKAERRQREADVEKMAENVLKGKPLKVEAQPIVSERKITGTKIVQGIRAYTLRPSRIADILDGGKGFKGVFHRTFIDKVNSTENAKLKAQDTRRDEGKAKLKDLDMGIRNLAETRVINETEYTVDQMIDIYVGFKNPLKKVALIFGNRIKEEDGNAIIADLTKEEKAFGDWIIKEYEENYNRLREAHIETTGEDMGWEKDYTPMRRTELDYATLDAEIADELLQRSWLRKGYAEKGFTIGRLKKIPPEFQKPLRLGAYATWVEQVNKQEHYIQFAEVVKRLHRLLNDKTLAGAVKQKFGDQYFEAMRNYVSRVANPNIYRSFTTADNISRWLRGNVSIAYLAYNLVTMAKQLPSLTLYLGQPGVGPARILAAAGEFMMRPFETIRFAQERDPQMKHRRIERELEELKHLNSSAYNRLQKTVGRKGMVGIYVVDKIATTIGWKAVYDANVVKEGETEAIRLAQNATLRTQPAAHAKDLPELYVTNEFLNWFLQFTNQLNNIYNMTTHDVPAAFKEGKYYRVFLSTLGLVTTAAFIWMINHRKPLETAEEMMDALKEQALNALPLIGRTAAAATEKWKASAPPFMKAAEAIGIAVSESALARKVKAALEATAIMVGLPYTGPKRIAEAIAEEDPSKLIGGPKKKPKWERED